MAKFEVEMVAFKSQDYGYGIRTVVVPDGELTGVTDNDLGRIYYWGQNDFQSQQIPSVSVGDVIRYDKRRYLVKTVGFEEVGLDEKGGFLRGYGLERTEKRP